MVFEGGGGGGGEGGGEYGVQEADPIAEVCPAGHRRHAEPVAYDPTGQGGETPDIFRMRQPACPMTRVSLSEKKAVLNCLTIKFGNNEISRHVEDDPSRQIERGSKCTASIPGVSRSSCSGYGRDDARRH